MQTYILQQKADPWLPEEEGIMQRGTETGRIILVKEYEVAFWSDRYILHLDCGDAFMGVDMSKLVTCTLLERIVIVC